MDLAGEECCGDVVERLRDAETFADVLGDEDDPARLMIVGGVVVVFCRGLCVVLGHACWFSFGRAICASFRGIRRRCFL